MSEDFEVDRSKYDNANEDRSTYKSNPGELDENLVREISKTKNEPEWMLDIRLKGLELYNKTPMPSWGPSLEKLDLDGIRYFIRPGVKESTSWDDLPDDIKETYDKIGIPEAEKKALSGVGAQYDSEIVYHNLKEEWDKQGVIFENMDVAVQKYPELVKKYFMTTCVPVTDHKFVMLHAAAWSGGTFIYIPKGVKVNIPLQAYFRMNAKNGGQFEHTLIIADEGSEVHYIEGCFTAGNKVLTSKGYKRIEDVKEHQEVLTSEGKYKLVHNLQKTSYSGNLYEVEYYGDSTQKITTTEEHPFLYVDRKRPSEKNKKFELRWNMPKFFKKGDYFVSPIDKIIEKKKSYVFRIVKHDNKAKKDLKLSEWEYFIPPSKELFRLIGYYLAEGSVVNANYLNFSFNKKERKYIEDVKECIYEVFGKKAIEVDHKKNNGTTVVVCDSDIARVFAYFGRSSDTKSLPKEFVHAPFDLQKEIIIAWYRGDGNYYNQKRPSGIKELFRINTTSEVLARQGKSILHRLGIVPFLNRQDRSKSGRKMMYVLGISGDQMIEFAKIVKTTVKKTLNGKKRAGMFGITKNHVFYPIKKVFVKTVKNKPVYNFSVNDHETYTVGDLAVHNCSAPQYQSSSLHAGCVELHVLKGAKIRYSSVENWSRNTFNLNTKRALVHDDGLIEWINGNLGSGVTMLYPASILMGKNARSDSLGIAFAGPEQNQDTGSKVIHIGENTKSTIVAKSISKGGGITTYRGLVTIAKNAKGCSTSTVCDALLVNDGSVSNTIPHINVFTDDANVAHEATVGKIGEEEIFYLMSRGLSEDQAIKMLVSGFIEPIVKQLPLEYAIELNKLIELEMTNSVG